MQVTVLFFATLKDRAGTDRLSLDLPDAATLDDLRAALNAQQPALAEHLKVAVSAINREFAFAGQVLNPGDEVAFFPPVSGGSGGNVWPEVFELADKPIDLNALTRAITSPATGAICLFSGAVRGETNADGQIVLTARLEYEAYAPMALAKMRQVAAEIRERWPLVQGMALVQRVGPLAVGEPTVLIACAAAHRDQGCFEAARYGIDRLKEIVPVWKKEVGPTGDHWVEGDYHPGPQDTASSTAHDPAEKR